MKEDEMSGAYSMHGEDEKYVWLKGLKGKDHSENLGIDGRTMLI
jgi:hypothetical protein